MLRISLKYFVICICCFSAVCLAQPNEAGNDAKPNPFEIMRAAVEARKEPVKPVEVKPVASSLPMPVSMPVEEEPELIMESVMLKFLRAENMIPAVLELLSPYGNVSADKETNTLIISCTRDKLASAIAQIRKADQTPRQIMIEVVILDVQLNDETEIGVDWAQTTFGRGDSTQTYEHTLVPSTVTTGATYGLIQDGINISVKALQESRDVEILASPRVMVVSGQTAHIKTAEEIPYEETSNTSAGGSLTSTKFKDVGLKLDVTAIITDEGKIMLMVNPSQSVKTGESVNEVPVVDNREVSTTLVMEDGQAVVIGGLRKKEETFTSHKVPLLSDIPLLGALFTSEKREILHSELLIMLSPHIVKNDAKLTDYQMKRFNQLKDRPPLQFESRKPKIVEIVTK